MNRYETITGILSWICLLSFASGTGILLLYHQGSTFSLVLVFLTLFSTSFFISGIRSRTIDADMIFRDFFTGIAAVLVSGLMLLLGVPYESMAVVATMSIYVVVLSTLARNRN